MRVKCLAQEHNTMSPARARTWSARSGVERTNHEATAPAKTFTCSHNLLNLFLIHMCMTNIVSTVCIFCVLICDCGRHVN